MRHSYHKRDALTGNMAQVEILDEVAEKINVDFDVWKFRRNELYLSQNEARQSVRENQPIGSETNHPNVKFATNVLERVVDEFLKMKQLPDDYNADNYFEIVNKIKYYTAVHSVLDYAHGIDAFFEFDLDDNKYLCVDLDATIDRKATDEIKADVLITYPAEGLDPKEDRHDWEQLVAITASDVVEKYLEKLIDRHDIKRRPAQRAVARAS